MPSRSDPFDDFYWKSCQVRLWIAYRNARLVRQYEYERPDGLAFDKLQDSLPPDPVCPDYEEQLLGALQAGKLTAIGLRDGIGLPCEVPSHHWAHLRILDFGGPRAAQGGLLQTNHASWKQLKFLRKAVLGLWSSSGNNPSLAPATDELGASSNELVNRGDYWNITYQGRTATLSNTLGLRYIAYLLREQGKEIHVRDLYYAVNPPDGGPANANLTTMTGEQLEELGLKVGDLGDAGDAMTPEGKRRIEVEIRQLEEQIDEASEFGETERQSELEAQQEEILRHLAAETGLGGRSRKASSEVERIRKAVTKRIQADIKKITEHHAALGQHLSTQIQTGTLCRYAPDPPVEWKFPPN